MVDAEMAERGGYMLILIAWDEHFGEFKIPEQLYESLLELGIIDFFAPCPTMDI